MSLSEIVQQTILKIAMTQASRLSQIENWLQQQGITVQHMEPACADASFRQYYRIHTPTGSEIIMDAPPSHERLDAFIDITQRLEAIGLHVPHILAQNIELGFLRLSDLGNTTFYQAITQQQNILKLYQTATLDALVTMQTASTAGLPVYDQARLLDELGLFTDWYVDKHCKTTLTYKEEQALQELFQWLTQCNDSEPKVFVHRDFHSPNLMICDTPPSVGIIDYQDALLGPISYDVASLVMDARTTFEEDLQLDLAIRYWQKAKQQGLPVPDDFAIFHEQYELMSLQRNLRILGVFARLSIRDRKSHYLDHMPRVKQYIRQVIQRYNRCKPLLQLFDRLDHIETEIRYTF